MRTLVNPLQTRLFDPFDSILNPKARQQLLDSWPGVFRHVLLELIPAGALAEHFAPEMAYASTQSRHCFDYSQDLEFFFYEIQSFSFVIETALLYDS